MSASLRWSGPETPRFDADGVRQVLSRLDEACFLVRDPQSSAGVGAVAGGQVGPQGTADVLVGVAPLPPERLGSAGFRKAHGVRYAYMAGAMANGIASEDLVVALARAGLLGSFGAAGLLPERISLALDRLEREIPGLPFACNLIHSPAEQLLERATVELYLQRAVRCVEASAFTEVTPTIVRYRVGGLRRDRDGRVVADNRLIAKVSRPELAEQFMRPAPESIVADLCAQGLLTAEQAALARSVALADDITVEADSGGHTDRRPLSVVLPAVLRRRSDSRHGLPVRIGVAGGLGSPEALAAAFAMGADYVVTGSVNQSCVEAGTSTAVKALLARASIADCAMAPAADMFEMGVDLQVLKYGTMFAMRATRLRALYRDYDGLEALPPAEVERLETQVFRQSLDDVWQECVSYFGERDPEQITRARGNSKRRMALVFRWYLGLSSHWATTGDPDRVADFQIWCGPAMGGFNDWVRGSYLADPENRQVAVVAKHLLDGAAYQLRLAQLRAAGAGLGDAVADYRPARPDPRGARSELVAGVAG